MFYVYVKRLVPAANSPYSSMFVYKQSIQRFMIELLKLKLNDMLFKFKEFVIIKLVEI